MNFPRRTDIPDRWVVFGVSTGVLVNCLAQRVEHMFVSTAKAAWSYASLRAVRSARQQNSAAVVKVPRNSGAPHSLGKRNVSMRHGTCSRNFALERGVGRNLAPVKLQIEFRKNALTTPG